MCCLMWMVFKREFADVLSGVNVVSTRICRCDVSCECCLNENFLDVLSGVDVV